MKYLYIYIPGLGDDSILSFQRKIVSKWETQQRKTFFVEPKWTDTKESYEDKLLRIGKLFNALDLDSYDRVCIFGTSAGGTLGFNLYIRLVQKYPGLRFVSAAGKITGSKYIGPRYSRPHPALIPSVKESEENIKISKSLAKNIFTITPLFDEVIYPRFMKIPGAKNKRLLVGGHIPAIVYVLKFRMNLIYKFVEN